jgi:DNA-binding MarR family transcriptional regulator
MDKTQSMNIILNLLQFKNLFSVRNYHNTSLSDEAMFILLKIVESNDSTLTHLNKETLISKPTLSRIIFKLMKLGFIKSFNLDIREDRRIIPLKITDEGLKFLDTFKHSISAVINDLEDYKLFLNELKNLNCQLKHSNKNLSYFLKIE